MRKLVFTILIVAVTCLASNAQATATDKQAASNEELKKELVSKFSFSEGKAEKILAIENEFHITIAATKALAENTEAEKKIKYKKEHEAHVLRRAKLMELPLAGREMEDVTALSEAIRRKYKP